MNPFPKHRFVYGTAELDAFLDGRRSGFVDARVRATVAEILDRVRRDGDDAVVAYSRQFDDPNFTVDDIQVAPDAMTEALGALTPEERELFEAAIDNVRTYQEHLLPSDPAPVAGDGARCGLRFAPMRRVGCAVPGGKAAYPSSAVMQLVPALVAGVPAGDIAVMSPASQAGGFQIDGRVLAVCALLGVERVYRIGGAQGIAALAFGTERVAAVDFISGPGNAFVTEAKRQVFGEVGIDGLYGPSEIAVIADRSANPAWVAADLIAQAEHGPGYSYLVAIGADVADVIEQHVAIQLADAARREIIETAMQEQSATIVVADREQAYAIGDRIAPEHLSLAFEDARGDEHDFVAGEVLIGPCSPVAAGDYWAGPSHCLPTGTSARFGSGLSVFTYLRRVGTIDYGTDMPETVAASIAAFAALEGLDGHAASAQIRRSLPDA